MHNPPSLPEPLDADALARLRELDPTGANKLVERVIQAYLASLERLVPEMLAAREPLDFVPLRRVAHTLKSSSASLGALLLSDHCGRVESMARDGLSAGIVAELDALLAELERVRAALTMMQSSTP